IDDPAGESTYLRLSTRSIGRVERPDDRWREGALNGGYWLREPGPGAEAAIVALGAGMPETPAAREGLGHGSPGPRPAPVTPPASTLRQSPRRPRKFYFRFGYKIICLRIVDYNSPR